MTEQSLLFDSIASISARLRDGSLSPSALTEQCLARIEVLNPKLNAFITVTAELARSQARQAERELRSGQYKGALHGIPVAVKDFYDTAGVRTTAGFEHFANRVPTDDADMVVRLREAGAVLIGKTNMHRLGMGTTSLDSYFGAVINPWSADVVAGGSSGGSAAALAAGMCFATVDTDAVGSGRLPAAICGVSCLKPTYGVFSGNGILAGEQADPAIVLLSHPSVMARSADDVLHVFTALAGSAASPQEQKSDTPLAVNRIGVVNNFEAGDEVRAALEQAFTQLASMDVAMVPIAAPFADASFDVSGIERARARINSTLFADVDVLLLPTLTAPAPHVDSARGAGDMAVSPNNTFFCNYFGLPAISVPCGVDRRGLPLAVQFVGPSGGDQSVLALAQAFQRALNWRYAPPQGITNIR